MTSTEYSPRVRAERVIASGRAWLALFALVGVILDPSDPANFAHETQELLIFYSTYAAVLWLVVSRGLLGSRRIILIEHAIDLLIAVMLTMLTHGSGSPFFLFFTFLLLVGTVRWQARGAWWTGAVVIVTYLGVAVYESIGMLQAGPVELNRFVVRLGLLSVMTMVLGQLGGYQQRLYTELRHLAGWPRGTSGTLDDVLRESLGYAARLLHAPVALLIWQQDEDEERTNLAAWQNDRLERETVADDAGDLVSVPDAVRSFLFVRGPRESRTIVQRDRPRDLAIIPICDALIEKHSVRTAIAAALPERTHRGWLMLFNREPRTLSTDDILLADIVAADISASVDHWYLSQRARDAAVAEERLRVSRDLHDGVLQSLTGCRLDIAATAAAAEGTASAIATQLRRLERSLAHEQQELREVIQHLRSAGAPRERGALRDLCARAGRQWHVSVTVSPEADDVIPPELNTSILLMVHEALANAVRHGKATATRVTVRRTGADLLVMIEDDGHGFPFKGRMQGAELAALNKGPRSLRERAEVLGGTLAVMSTDTGSTVEIRVPVTRESVCA